MLAPTLTAVLLSLPLLAGARSIPLHPLQGPQASAVLPAVDPALQDGIERLLGATSAPEQRAALAALRARGGVRHERLVVELFRFSLAARDTREAMLPGFVLATLRVPAEDVVLALVPFLESQDERLLAGLARVLSQYEDPSIERGASFTVYRELVARGPTPGLARHLFRTDPGAALLSLARAEVRDPEELRALLLAAHEIADLRWRLARGIVTPEALDARARGSLGSLAFLAGHPRWFARLAAAEVARAEPALRAAVPLEALRRDEHALVRAAATF